MTIDLHIDIPWQCFRQERALQLDAGCKSVQTDFPRMKAGGLSRFVAALYLADSTQDRLGPEKSWNAIKTQYNWLKQWQDKQLLFALEGGRLINQSKERLTELASWGIVYLGLTHNRNTSWADSATDKLTHNGLTAVGKSLVRAIHAQKILVDVSHSSDRTILDALEIGPVIASHSGVRSQVDHPRNLSDTLIRFIAESGGLIGVPYATRFVGSRDGVIEAIDHIAQLTGSCQHIGIGSDLDGADTVIEDVSQWSEVLEPLTDFGYPAADIEAITGGNFRRLIDARRSSQAETKS